MKKAIAIMAVISLALVSCKKEGDSKVSDVDTVDVVVQDTVSVVKDTVITIDTLK